MTPLPATPENVKACYDGALASGRRGFMGVYETGKGLPASACPYAEGTDQHAAWMSGWVGSMARPWQMPEYRGHLVLVQGVGAVFSGRYSEAKEIWKQVVSDCPRWQSGVIRLGDSTYLHWHPGRET